MSRMAIMLGLPSRSSSSSSSEEKSSHSKEGDAGYEMFMAFCDAMGVVPKDPQKAYNRLCALDSIWDTSEGEDGGGDSHGGY